MKEYSQIVVGKQIKKYRIIKKLSQKELAKFIGVSSSYIGELERGSGTANSSISMENICKIATVLNVSLDTLAHSNLEYQENTISNLANEIIQEINNLSLEDLLLFYNIIHIIKKNHWRI